MKGKLVFENRGLDAEIVDEKAFSVLSRDRLRILRALSEEALYPAELAKRLDEQVQTVYYHVRLLQKAGLLNLVEYEEKGGALAKKYKANANAIAFVLKEDWKPFHSGKENKHPSFLSPFISSGFFDGKFVVGSPDPHGKYRTRGSEFCAMELAMFLGNYACFSYPLYFLDTELRDKAKRDNLILLGGPKVNTLVSEVNPSLPIAFDEKTFDLKSSISKKTYTENVGVLEIVDNPFNKSKKIMVVAGSTHLGTRIGVLALLKYQKKIKEGNLYDSSKVAKVLQGFDEDGDGIVDAVEVLE